jgi:hypothetical protein
MSKDKDNHVTADGGMVTSAVGDKVYVHPDDLPPAAAPTPPVATPVPEAPALPARAPAVAIDEVLAQARAIVAAAKFTRRVDKRDPHCETIEFRRRSAHPIGEPGAVTTATGDEAIMELTAFCVGYLQAMGVWPPDEALNNSDEAVQ